MEDYIASDGLLYCGKCKTPKQAQVRGKTVPVLCKCRKEELEADRKHDSEIARLRKLARMRQDCFPASELARCTFDADDRRLPKISDALQRYADKWDEMCERKIGLLLYGGVGTGKTFYAACIANRLIERGVAAKMTSFARITNDMQEIPGERREYLTELVRYPLLILDDLGAERASEYMLEQVYTVVNARYETGKPMIITTNLPIEEIKEPNDLRRRRVYDRVLERCQPIKVSGDSRRRNALKSQFWARQDMLGIDAGGGNG